MRRTTRAIPPSTVGRLLPHVTAKVEEPAVCGSRSGDEPVSPAIDWTCRRARQAAVSTRRIDGSVKRRIFSVVVPNCRVSEALL